MKRLISAAVAIFIGGSLLAIPSSHPAKDPVDALKKELTLFPESLEARILLTFVYFEQGRGQDAAAGSKEFLAAFEAIKKKKPKPNWEDFPRQHPKLGLPNYILGLCEKNRGNLFFSRMRKSIFPDGGLRPSSLCLRSSGKQSTGPGQNRSTEI
jgi:hypothetical protein